MSSDIQLRIALAVAHNLTNLQQSTTLMQEFGRVPVNRNFEVGPRVYPVLAGFRDQSRTAVALPDEVDREVFFRGFGESSLNFELAYWIEQSEHARVVGSDLCYMIWDAFAENEIEIPYPQRDLI